MRPPLQIIRKGTVDYETCFKSMREYTLARDEKSSDQLWITDHHPVYTLGRIGDPKHFLKKTTFPVIQTDRGGKVTYHGPGQIIIYVLIDIFRANIGIKTLINALEDSAIDTLAHYNIEGFRKANLPGVYTEAGKISALGLSCKKRGTYHGISLNVSMDLSPFNSIAPCGLKQNVIDMHHFGITESIDVIADKLALKISQNIFPLEK